MTKIHQSKIAKGIVLLAVVAGLTSKTAVAFEWPYSECDAPLPTEWDQNPRMSGCDKVVGESGEYICEGICLDTRDPQDTYPNNCSASVYSVACVPKGQAFYRQEKSADCVLIGEYTNATCDCPIDIWPDDYPWVTTDREVYVDVCDTVPVT